MQPRRLVWTLAAPLLLACGLERPASFSELDLERARELAPSSTLIEAVEPDEAPSHDPGSVLRWNVLRWKVGSEAPPRIPEGPVLLVAPSPALGYRSAAELARSGNRFVRLVIVDDADERRALYGRAAGDREPSSGEPSSDHEQAAEPSRPPARDERGTPSHGTSGHEQLGGRSPGLERRGPQREEQPLGTDS